MGTVKYTGPIASFHCPTNAEIRSLKVHFSPKQLGEGDPSPENEREIVGWDGVEVRQSGKNLFNINVPFQNPDNTKTNFTEKRIFTPNSYCAGASFSNYFNDSYVDSYEISNNVLTVNSRQGYSVGFALALMPGCSYFIDATTKGSSPTIEIANYSRDGTFLQKSTTNYLNKSFVVPENAERTVLCFRGSPLGGDAIFSNIQLELGNSATSYESYRGFTTNYEFGVLGKNKLDVSGFIDGEYVKSDGSIMQNSEFRRTDYLHLTPSNYVYSATKTDGTTAYVRACGYDKSKTFVAQLGEQLKGSGNYEMAFTVPENVYYIILQSYKANTNEQLELGSTATAYEPYDPNKTVYGGWVDLISGEVCEEYHKMIIDKDSKVGIMPWLGTHTDPTTGEEFTGALWTRSLDDPKAAGYGRMKCYCDQYPYHTLGTSTRVMNTAGMYDGDTYGPSLLLPISLIGTTKESLAEFMQDKTFTFVYQLKDPIYYNLPPHSTTLKTFLSHNNIWSNADYVEVEYDLHETQTILARKQFIVANQPHIVKPAAAPLQSFTTDMAAALKECKVYFSPVQDISNGAPSPDNICPISGWENIEINQSGKNLNNNWLKPEGITASGYYNGYSSWAKDWAVPASLIGVTLRYSAFIDNTGTTDTRDAYLHIWTKDANGTYVRTNATSTTHLNPGESGRLAASITPRDTEVFISCGLTMPAGCKASEPLLEIGSIETDYEPYTGTTIPITFPSEAGTVYGGYVDLVTGEVVQEWYTISIDETAPMRNYIADARNQGTYCEASYWLSTFNAPNAAGYEPYSTDGYCNILPYIENNYANEARASASNSVSSVCLSGVKTQEEYLAWIAEYGPLVICYRLATPIHYTLTPTQLKTLRGTNNIWASNGGDNVEIAYWKH